MRLHGGCVARDGEGVLLVGAPGSGKSDLMLRLIDRGFALVADDQVDVDGLQASAPSPLAGRLEVRGLGIVQLPFLTQATLRLVVHMGCAERMPIPQRYEHLDLPAVTVDPSAASAPMLVCLALDGVQGNIDFMAGFLG